MLLFVRVFSLHFLWFVVFFVITVLSALLSFFVFYANSSLFLSFSLFSTSSIDLKVSFILDFISLSFMTAVLTISTIIIIYSFNYMSPYSKPSYFLWLTVLFVTSILLVITIPNLFFAMLGWDGLGLVSFFLIVYYQNQSSIVSGVFTLMINRLGDRFFLCSLILIFYALPDFTYFSSRTASPYLVSFLVLTFMTKRAIYPFSPWLPMAIAAPTPISALVHSSTLVTAGLYFIMRYRYVLYSCPQVIIYLFIARLFTSFYAGINTIFEVDLKKLIALSTLRHLGFIGMAFSIGLLYLSFFHLLVHALFKSLLFMTIGDIIINLNHSQDARYLSTGGLYTPFSCFLIRVSLVNLLGLPRLRGFFSKDLVLETISFSNVSWFLELVLYCNVIFTYYYSYKLFFFSFQSVKLVPYQIFHSPYIIHSLLILFLSLSTLIFSTIFINFIYSYVIFYFIVPTVKFLPLALNISMFMYLLLFLVLPTLKQKKSFAYFSSMLYLRNLIIRFISILYLKIIFNSVKRIEIGFLNYSINVLPSIYFISLSNTIYQSLYKVQLINLIIPLLFLFIIILTLSM